MKFEHGSPGAAADPSLAAWRRDAADIVLAATTLVHLPAVLLFMLGYGLPTTLTVRALVAAGYAVMIFSAFARRSMWRSEASDSPRTSLGRSAPRSAFRRAAASRWTLGWRWLAADYESGSGASAFKWDVIQQGPVLGLVFAF